MLSASTEAFKVKSNKLSSVLLNKNLKTQPTFHDFEIMTATLPPRVTAGTSEWEPPWDLTHAQWAQTLTGSSSFITLSLWGTNSHQESKSDPCWSKLTGLVHICHELRVRYRKSHSSGIWGGFEDKFSIVTCASEIHKVMNSNVRL